MGNFGSLQPAQFIGIGELVETFQSEKLQEQRGGFVKERTTRLLGAARHTDHFPFQQRGDHAVDGHAAH
jgi:hypothetical protein